MMTRGYVRFSGLFPVFPVFRGNPRRKTGKGTPRPCLVRVLSAAVAGKFPAGAWGVVLRPRPVAFDLVRVIRGAWSDCCTGRP